MNPRGFTVTAALEAAIDANALLRVARECKAGATRCETERERERMQEQAASYARAARAWWREARRRQNARPTHVSERLSEYRVSWRPFRITFSVGTDGHEWTRFGANPDSAREHVERVLAVEFPEGDATVVSVAPLCRSCHGANTDAAHADMCCECFGVAFGPEDHDYEHAHPRVVREQPAKPYGCRRKTCACCGGDAGSWQQWWNRDHGYGICAGCVDWMTRRNTPRFEIEELYGVEGVNWGRETAPTPNAVRERPADDGPTCRECGDPTDGGDYCYNCPKLATEPDEHEETSAERDERVAFHLKARELLRRQLRERSPEYRVRVTSPDGMVFEASAPNAADAFEQASRGEFADYVGDAPALPSHCPFCGGKLSAYECHNAQCFGRFVDVTTVGEGYSAACDERSYGDPYLDDGETGAQSEGCEP
jgi:hypothetical protein